MLIQSPDIARKLQRKLRLQSLPDSVLSPETVGVIVVEDLSDPLGGSSRGCMGSALSDAVAAEYSHVTLSKMSDGADVVVHGMWFSANVTEVFYLVVSDSATIYTTVVDTAFDDRNLPGRPSSRIQQGTNIIPSSGATISQQYVAARTTQFIPLNVSLGFTDGALGAGGIFVRATTVNVAIRVGWAWTESDPLG